VLSGPRFVGILLAAAAIASCSKSSPTEPALDLDSVTIVSLQPPAGTVLQAGARVIFTATIGYHLVNAASGSVFIVVQDQALRNLSSTVPVPSVNVVRETGTVGLSDSVVIPAAGVTSVGVFFPLLQTGATMTLTVQSVSYSVAPAPGAASPRVR
jgi:hypothetical protein